MTLANLKALMPGNARADWHTESSKTPVFNPYSSGMWVIKVEDYLYKHTANKKWTWKKPILRDGNKVLYRWVGRKARNQAMAPSFHMAVEYVAGRDLFDVETYFTDADGKRLAGHKSRGVGIEQVLLPETLFDWVPKKWDKKAKTFHEAIEEAKRPTFKAAREALFTHLEQEGWELKRRLKIPHATESTMDPMRLWFKKQAVWYTYGHGHKDFKEARSLHVDIRDMTPEQFMKYVERWRK